MRHQNLTELETLIKGFLVVLTNQAYAYNNKFGYRLTWTKGTKEIEGDGKRHTNYYVLRFFIVDKNESPIGKEITLIENYYPIVGLQSKEKLEEEAYKEFLLNGIRSLYNITYSNYLQHKDKEYVQPSDVQINEAVEQIKEEAKTPKLIYETGRNFN